jgi:hypothetical protein
MVLAPTISLEEFSPRDQSSSSILEEQQQRVPVEQEECGPKRMFQSVDRFPAYISYVKLLCVVFPESKYRHLLGTALQIQRQHFFSLATLSDRCCVWQLLLAHFGTLIWPTLWLVV